MISEVYFYIFCDISALFPISFLAIFSSFIFSILSFVILFLFLFPIIPCDIFAVLEGYGARKMVPYDLTNLDKNLNNVA